ncbi:MAG: co-chaperone YbbN [Nocardioidaceae bacterium]
MSTPSFSRPGAVDLSALKRPAPSAGGPAPTGGSAGGGTGTGAYSVDLNEQNFQAEIQRAAKAPVLLVFHSAKSPESVTLAGDLDTLADEFEGRFLLGKVDVDVAPGIAQALQIPSVPLVALAMGGQLAPLLQEAPPLEELRALLDQVLQAAASQGLTGRVEPRGVAQPEDPEEQVDPRYAPAQDAMAEGDMARAVAEYQKLVDANPADVEAAGGLAMAKVLERTLQLDANQAQAARTAAAEAPDDVDAQTLVADLDLAGGHVDDAFGRLIDLVRRTSGDDRDKARTHLLGLFAAVGNDDPRVLKGRQGLASALF